MNHPALRLTPSNSPFFKPTPPRSPTKTPGRTDEPGLRLSKAIGATTTSPNGFDCLPGARKFAYTAGAAAVVATVGDDWKIEQRFFRARPTLAGPARDANAPWPVSPTPSEARSRTLGHGHAKDANALPSASLGLSAGRDWPDSPTGRSTTARDRVKAATSVALSPNGKWLALGETGYKPRILIFSLADRSDESPLTVLAEHTFGVHALSFSPDSKYLASLGAVNDGFLYIWTIDDRFGSATLSASNKCTTLVHCMVWVGRCLITAGLRFVKVWRPDDDAGADGRRTDSTLSPHTPRKRAENRPQEFGNSILSPKHKVLGGKNCLLGDMLEGNFVAVLPISSNSAILCAESGEICLLNDVETAQTLTVAATVEFEVSAARLDHSDQLHVSGTHGQGKSFSIADLQAGSAPLSKSQRRKTVSPNKPSRHDRLSTAAAASIADSVIELDSKGGVTMSASTDSDKAIRERLPAHEGAILGVAPISCEHLPGAVFLTFSGAGDVRMWDSAGTAVAALTVPIESLPDVYDVANELRAVAPFSSGHLLAYGDRYGMLTILDTDDKTVRQQIRAHSTEITDICAFERSGFHFLVTASRDRTVQLFAWSNGELELLQTLDEHAGAVTGLLATPDGERLLSCSADRTIVVREAMLRNENDSLSLVFGMTRAITLKSAPTSMCAGADDTSIWVSSADRNITRYNLRNGQASSTFKCSDLDGGEAAVMSKILFTTSLNGTPTVVGIASSDKSVRLYTESGTLVARDWGHTEGITGLVLLPDANNSTQNKQHGPRRLVTVAADSTIFIWDTTPAPSTASPQKESDSNAGEVAGPNKTPLTGPPLRKVISYSELSRVRRESSLDEADPPSPTTPIPLPSPHRLRKKTSRMSVAQAPRLEPSFRSSFADSSRQRSHRQRSPSPPSPRNSKKDNLRRPSLGMSLRSKSSENVLNSFTSTHSNSGNGSAGFGSLTASTESLSRTLRVYRRKLVNSSTGDSISPEALRELEKELKLTARVLSEKSQGKTLDEAMMARLLDQASEKIVGMLDERIRDRVGGEVRKSSDASPTSLQRLDPPLQAEERGSPNVHPGAAQDKAVLDENG